MLSTFVYNLLGGASESISNTTSSVPPSPENTPSQSTQHADSDELPAAHMSTQPVLTRSCSEEAKLAAEGKLPAAPLLTLFKQASFEAKTQSTPTTTTASHSVSVKLINSTATSPVTLSVASSSVSSHSVHEEKKYQDEDDDSNEFGVNFLFNPEKIVHKSHIPMSASVRQRFKRKMRKNHAKKKQEREDKKWREEQARIKLEAELAAKKALLAQQKALAEAKKKAEQERLAAEKLRLSRLTNYHKDMELPLLVNSEKELLDTMLLFNTQGLLDQVEVISKTDSRLKARKRAQERIDAAKRKAEEEAAKKQAEEEAAKKKAEAVEAHRKKLAEGIALGKNAPLAPHLDPTVFGGFAFPFSDLTVEEEAKMAPPAKTFWSKGTGYGHGGQASLDADKYLAQQRQAAAALRYTCRLLAKQFQSKDQIYTVEQLEQSALIPMLESYLQNDSITDVMEQHSGLYIDLLNLVEHMANHPTYRILLAALPNQRKSIVQLNGELAAQAEKLLKFDDEHNEVPTEFVMSDFERETWSGYLEYKIPEYLMANRSVVQCIIRTQRILNEKVACIQDSLAKKAQAEEAAAAAVAAAESKAVEEKSADEAEESKKQFDTYVKLMDNLKFDEVDQEGFTTHKYVKENAAASSSSSSSGNGAAGRVLARRLATEYSDLSKSLPIHPESSIVLRHHDTQMKYCRFMVSGPKDTPYENGLFLFDAYFPDTYPQTPPKVNLYTTGYGAVRFNPNLYHCGKVCLSILGTWGGSAGEGWVPKQSTFLQVLVSIQSLVFVPQPYFNEPGYESTMGTPNGVINSANYSKPLYLETIRWAMIDQMKKPPKGFEDVVRVHFALKKKEIMAQVQKWKEEKNPAISTVMEELETLLNQQELKDTDFQPKAE